MNALLITSEQRIIAKAMKGLNRVKAGEDEVMQGWVMYGAALNEGREMFKSDEQFGQWVRVSQLETHGRDDRVAAMWAAANPEEYRALRKAHPRVRTVRGLHAKYTEQGAKPKPRLNPTPEDLQTMSRLKNLAERGSTEGERAAAHAKLEAYSSAFGESKEELLEKVDEVSQGEEYQQPESVIIKKFHNRLKRKDQDWLIDQLLWAMHEDRKIFKTIAERLFDQ